MLTIEESKAKVFEFAKQLMGDMQVIQKHGLTIYENETFEFERGWIFSFGPNPTKPPEPPVVMNGGAVILVDKFNNVFLRITYRPWIDKFAEYYMDSYEHGIDAFKAKVGLPVHEYTKNQ